MWYGPGNAEVEEGIRRSAQRIDPDQDLGALLAFYGLIRND